MPKKKPFYGWWSLSGAVLVTFIGGGAFINAFGVFLPVLCDKFGWSRGEVSTALSLGILSFGLPSFLFSILVNKLGARFTIFWGNLLAGLGFIALYFVNGIWQLYMIYIFIGFMSGFGGFIACTVIANNWFVKRRPLAMSLISASAGAAGFVFPPLAAGLINAVGWRGAWLVLAGIMVCGAIIGGWLLVRNRPEDIGQTPDGIPPSPVFTQESLKVKTDSANWTMSRILKMPVTYLILGFIIANAFTMGTTNAHQIAYIEDTGFTSITAATVMSVLAIFSLIGSLGFGALALKINMRYLAAVGLLSQLIGFIILLTTKNLTMLFVYAAFMGLGVGALFTALPSFMGAYYPRERYAQVTGFVLPFHVVAQAIAASAAGAIHDATGQYTSVFIVLAVCVVGGSVCAFFARQPKGVTG